MADTQGNPGMTFWRGGKRVPVVETPGRFTVRMKRGVPANKVEDASSAVHRQRLRRLDLDEFVVDPEERDDVMAAVRNRPDTEFASHVYTPADDPKAELFLTDEITVQFKPEVADAMIEQLAAAHGLLLQKDIPGLTRAYVFRVGPDAVENPIKITNRLAQDENVLASEPNVAVASRAAYRPVDTLYREQWHLFTTGGPMLSTAAHIDAERAWDITRGDRSVIVAVADDSCDTGHADFQGPGKIVAPQDFGGKDFDSMPELADDNHGTACCGVAVAEETGTGVVGVAPACALMPIRTSGFIDDSGIDALCEWVVTHGAAVLSCSWSAAAREFPLSLRMKAALANAATLGRGGKGCVLVFAAGNENRPVNGTVDERGWPNNQPRGPTRWHNGFAAHPDVMAVAASSSMATKSAYSNWGAEISVCAPSNNVRPGTFPLVSVPVTGRGIVTTDRVSPSGYSADDYTRSFGGTSSATPTVAGAAALVIAANPALTAREVRAILESTADKITDANPDPQLGQQLGSYDASGHSPWFGHGRINVFRAVTQARQQAQPPAGAALSARAQPRLAIPDANPAGIRHSLALEGSALVSAVAVDVDIAHSYIGDLRLTLVAPSGSQAVLHDRNGGSADNLVRRFDSSHTPALAALAGEPVRGAWTLWVQDLAAADVGTLTAWGIEIQPRPGAVVEVAEAPGQRIPDSAAAGIERTLTVDRSGTLASIDVSIDITHSYIGDLRVALVAPDSTEAVLHARSGGSADNLVTTYAFATVPALRALAGRPVQGGWRLRVVDSEAADEGKLNRWSLRIVTA